MIKITASGLKEVHEFIHTLPRGIKITAMRIASEYLIGNDWHGLKHYPERIEHGEGNPYQWQSDKQRKAFFASDGFGGSIPSQRTNELKNSWIVTESDSNWSRVKIENTSEHAVWIMGEYQQRGHIADGWRYWYDVIISNLAGAIQRAQRAVDAWIKFKS